MHRQLSMMCAIVLVLTVSAVYGNNPPVADAGPDIHIYLGEFALLEGSAWDPDDDPIVWWEWIIEARPAGSNAELSDPYVPDPYIIPDLEGDYVFSLVASDGVDQSSPDTCVVVVERNLPPVAIIAADRDSGCAPLCVHFDGEGSYDPEGGPLSYLWDFNDGSVYSTDPSPDHEFEFAGLFEVRLIVVDDFNQQTRDYVTIMVGMGPSSVMPSTWGRIKSLYK